MLRRRNLLTICIFVGALLGGTSLAGAGFTSAEDLVKSIYALYSAKAEKTGGQCKHEGNGFPESAGEVGRYLEPALARAYLHTTKLDADPFIMGQDWCIRDLVISAGPNDGKKASVTASFKNLDAAAKVEYQLVNTGQGWLVFDLSSADFPSLRKFLGVKN
jgi:hypothetical protein